MADILKMVKRFALGVHESGAPAHVVEAMVSDLLIQLDRKGGALVTPTSIFLEMDGDVRLLRPTPSDPRMDKLASLARWARATTAETPKKEQLYGALTAPAPYSDTAQLLALAWGSGMGGLLLGNTLADAVFAGFGGGLVGLALRVLAGSRWHGVRVFLVALIAGLWGALGTAAGAQPLVVGLAAVLWFVPGVSMTMAMAELGQGHLSSGTARLQGSLFTAAMLAAGLVIGSHAFELETMIPTLALPPSAMWAAPVLAPVAFGVLLGLSHRDLPFITAIATVGFCATMALPGAMGVLLAAFIVGSLGNWRSRRQGMVPQGYSVPGILLLVPGSLGVQGVRALMENQFQLGTELVVQTLVAAGALALGLLLSHALFPVTAAAADKASQAQNPGHRNEPKARPSYTRPPTMNQMGGRSPKCVGFPIEASAHRSEPMEIVRT